MLPKCNNIIQPTAWRAPWLCCKIALTRARCLTIINQSGASNRHRFTKHTKHTVVDTHNTQHKSSQLECCCYRAHVKSHRQLWQQLVWPWQFVQLLSVPFSLSYRLWIRCNLRLSTRSCTLSIMFGNWSDRGFRACSLLLLLLLFHTATSQNTLGAIVSLVVVHRVCYFAHS